jgi:two-component system phosphate regulon response regulator PhoB
VRYQGRLIPLSATEFDILLFLSKNPGWVYSRNQIISGVKGDDYPVTERSVDVQILSLRKKLAEKAKLIETVRGIGYRLKEESHDH